MLSRFRLIIEERNILFTSLSPEEGIFRGGRGWGHCYLYLGQLFISTSVLARRHRRIFLSEALFIYPIDYII